MCNIQAVVEPFLYGRATLHSIGSPDRAAAQLPDR
jgi:hypothetical protein